MGFTDLFWFFIIFAALQPILRQKMLQVQRLRILRRLERQRNSLAITLIHRQETMSFLGFPILPRQRGTLWSKPKIPIIIK